MRLGQQLLVSGATPAITCTSEDGVILLVLLPTTSHGTFVLTWAASIGIDVKSASTMKSPDASEIFKWKHRSA